MSGSSESEADLIRSWHKPCSSNLRLIQAEVVAIAKAAQDGPGCLQPPPLNEERIQEDETIQCQAFLVDALHCIIHLYSLSVKIATFKEMPRQVNQILDPLAPEVQEGDVSSSAISQTQTCPDA